MHCSILYFDCIYTLYSFNTTNILYCILLFYVVWHLLLIVVVLYCTVLYCIHNIIYCNIVLYYICTTLLYYCILYYVHTICYRVPVHMGSTVHAVLYIYIYSIISTVGCVRKHKGGKHLNHS